MVSQLPGKFHAREGKPTCIFLPSGLLCFVLIICIHADHSMPAVKAFGISNTAQDLPPTGSLPY